MYCSAVNPASGAMFSILFLARLRYWMRFKSLIALKSVIAFPARSSDASARHFSRPLKSLMPALVTLMVER